MRAGTIESTKHAGAGQFMLTLEQHSSKLVLALGALFLGYVIVSSLTWPLIRDAPISSYVAWLISQGMVPYRDIFEYNFPGVYLIHLLALKLFGVSDLGWRLFDLAWLSVTAAWVFAYCRRYVDLQTSLAASLLFAFVHLAGGPLEVGERDFLLCPFLLLAVHGVACSLERRGKLAPLMWGGLAAGAAITIKPFPILFLMACAAAAAFGFRRHGRSMWAAAGTVIGSGMVMPALVIGWLWVSGGLSAFVAILVEYLIPFRPLTISPWELLLKPWGWLGSVIPTYVQLGPVSAKLDPLPFVLFFGALVSLLLFLSVRQRWSIRDQLCVMGIVYGGLHYAFQGKGLFYHLYPLLLFASVLVGMTLAPAPSMQVKEPLGLVRLRNMVVRALFAALVIGLGAKGLVQDKRDESIAVEEARVKSLVDDLRRLVAPGEAVQVLDDTAGGVHALYTLKIRQPTRFIYDFTLLQHGDDPRIQALRAEFIAGLTSSMAAAIVVTRNDMIFPEGFERLRDFPEVERLLAEHYVVASDQEGYRVFVKRPGPQ